MGLKIAQVIAFVLFVAFVIQPLCIPLRFN